MRVIVVGAGASGLLTAINISEKYEVILLDSNNKCCKKILVTGNGKCNYWNSDIDINKYQTDNYYKLDKILKNKDKVLNYLESIGVYPKIKNGYYYPNSNQASSIKEILERELKRKNIRIIYNFKVEDIKKENNKFLIKSIDGQVLKSDKIVLSTGSKSLSKTGSDGSGYILAKNLGHTINEITPSLVPLIMEERNLKEWTGVRCEASVSVYINNKKEKEETGEIQLTSNGVSGICIFNISGLISKSLRNNYSVELNINFLPNLGYKFYDWLEKRNKAMKKYNIGELLEGVLNYKLLNVIYKTANINPNKYLEELVEQEKQNLAKCIEQFKITIVNTESFDKSQVCTGGIPLDEINPDNMESKIISNLYIVGEILDVDGICGGYNLAFAFITGFLAGRGL